MNKIKLALGVAIVLGSTSVMAVPPTTTPINPLSLLNTAISGASAPSITTTTLKIRATPLALQTGVSISGTNKAKGSAIGAGATASAFTANTGAGLSTIDLSSGTNNSQTGLAVNTAATKAIANQASSLSGGQILFQAGSGAASTAKASIKSTSLVTATQFGAGFHAPTAATSDTYLPGVVVAPTAGFPG